MGLHFYCKPFPYVIAYLVAVNIVHIEQRFFWFLLDSINVGPLVFHPDQSSQYHFPSSAKNARRGFPFFFTVCGVKSPAAALFRPVDSRKSTITNESSLWSRRQQRSPGSRLKFHAFNGPTGCFRILRMYASRSVGGFESVTVSLQNSR